VTDSLTGVLLSGFWEQVESGFYVESCPVRLTDFMPCHDAERSKSFAKERNHYRERHCPPSEEKLRCLIPPPPAYQIPVRWPVSLQKVSFELCLWFVGVLPNGFNLGIASYFVCDMVERIPAAEGSIFCWILSDMVQ
jgi:hypothetical protein